MIRRAESEGGGGQWKTLMMEQGDKRRPIAAQAGGTEAGGGWVGGGLGGGRVGEGGEGG